MSAKAKARFLLIEAFCWLTPCIRLWEQVRPLKNRADTSTLLYQLYFIFIFDIPPLSLLPSHGFRRLFLSQISTSAPADITIYSATSSCALWILPFFPCAITFPIGVGGNLLMFERALSTGSAIYLQVCCLQIKTVPVRSGTAQVNLCTLSVQIMQTGTQWPYRSSQVMVLLIYLHFNLMWLIWVIQNMVQCYHI